MAEIGAARLRTLAAEIRRELEALRRTVAELEWVEAQGDSESAVRIRIYASAAMLDTFYTGIERVLERVARVFGNLPDGPGWHRELLASAALDVPLARPPVLREQTVVVLARYLAFRHRFRNLYLFDLEPEQMEPLIAGAADALAALEQDLQEFAEVLDALAAGG